ncbi:uncharacterized protein LOC142172591 [Nicotiana tabacum]|uniref:Uncharacterized protein LOC142172591 n=1 Tax=Nicotiana tabacum TaxID=4097 RepID=A0AC58T559_TOBAC
MEGYFNRIWGKLGIDIVSQVQRDVFLVRFHTIESRTKVVEGGVQMFDRKPVIVKQWQPDIEMKKEIMDNIPVWIRLSGLNVKYCGKQALAKITGMVGNPLKADKVTTMKERMTYARVLVEVPINKVFPDTVIFENEHGHIVEQEMDFEWKPILCTKCKNYGHELKECRKYIREEINNKAQERKEVVQQGEEKTSKGEQTETSKEVDKETCIEEKFHQRVGKQVMVRQKQDNFYYRRGNARRGIVIREPQINTENSFAALGKQNNRNERIAKPSYPGGARRKLWDGVNQIRVKMDGPWAVMRDFNCVLNREERIGSKVTMAETRDFRQCIEVCGLKELRSSRAFFTWNNKQGGDSRVYIRIDRVLVNAK